MAPTGRGGRSSIRESCLTRCPLLRTGRAWAASGSMCEVTGWAIPTGSNEPPYGRTDTKSPMVYSSMVPVAGGEGGSIRHDDDGRPTPSGGSQLRWSQPHSGSLRPIQCRAARQSSESGLLGEHAARRRTAHAEGTGNRAGQLTARMQRAS